MSTPLRFIFLCAFLLLGALIALKAQGDFQLIGSGGQASLGNNCYRLTQAQNTAYGGLWYRWQADLNENFEINAELGFGSNDFGADGIVFAFQNLCTNVGSTGGGMGIEGVNPSLIIEFDTYFNGENSDLLDDHIGILRDGILVHNGPSSLAPVVCALPNCGNIETGLNYPIRISWQVATQTLDVYFDGTLRSSYTGDIVNSIFNGNSMVYWGFTSATGGFNNLHTVCINNFTDNQQQPEDAIWCANQTISFSVGNPVPSVTYQWQVSSNDGASFVNVSNSAVYGGSTTPTLTLNNPPNSFIGNLYQVIISGCDGQFISDPAVILAGDTIQIMQQPQDLELCANTPASLDVVSAEASAYQWQEFISGNWVNLSDDPNSGINGTQTSTLNLDGAASTASARRFRCLLRADCSADVYSNEVTITFTPGPAIETQPENAEVCPGENLSFWCEASGAGLSYQWFVSNDAGVNYTALANDAQFSQVNTDSLVINNAGLNLQEALFQCIISSDCGNPVQTNPVSLSILFPPAIDLQPIDAEVCEGTSVQFMAGSATPASWQWEFSSDGGLSFQNIPAGAPYTGVNSSTLSINPVSAQMHEWLFRARASGCGLDVVSASASLLLLPELLIQPILQDTALCEGQSLQITLAAENANTYQWELNIGAGFQPLQNAPGISGVSNATLSIGSMPPGWHLAQLRCTVNGACGALSSNVLSLQVNGLPVLFAQPEVLPICAGTLFTIPIQAQGVGIDYQWEILDASGQFIPLNAAGFSGVTSQNLYIESRSDMNGNILRCVLSGCDAVLTTDSITLNILENDPVYIPNSFSPNEDFINSEFRVYTAGNPRISGTIYSRWGNLIYSWTENTPAWDGKFNGTFVPEGVYVYKIRVETACEVRNYTGGVLVIR